MPDKWRLAGSLVAARNEIITVWPDAVIGTLASPEHARQSPVSDHNPYDDDNNPDTPAVVTALDAMAGAIDCAELVRRILVKPHPDLAYVIWNRGIYHRRTSFQRAIYGGTDPHTNHAHISVGTGTDGSRHQPFDDAVSWGIVLPVQESDTMRIIEFLGETQLYGTNGEMIGGRPVLVPLTGFDGGAERVAQWIASGVPHIRTGQRLNRDAWYITKDNDWPDSAKDESVPTSPAPSVDVAALADALFARFAGLFMTQAPKL